MRVTVRAHGDFLRRSFAASILTPSLSPFCIRLCSHPSFLSLTPVVCVSPHSPPGHPEPIHPIPVTQAAKRLSCCRASPHPQEEHMPGLHTRHQTALRPLCSHQQPPDSCGRQKNASLQPLPGRGRSTPVLPTLPRGEEGCSRTEVRNAANSGLSRLLSCCSWIFAGANMQMNTIQHCQFPKLLAVKHFLVSISWVYE